LTQSGLHGVIPDVIGHDSEVFWSPHIPIKIVRHPETALPVEKSIALFGGERFPGVDDFLLRVTRKEFNQHMRMVGHDALF